MPELENAIADKNVLAMHVRESLKEVDEILKCLKNKNSEKLKAEEQKLASVQMELESVNNKKNHKNNVIKMYCIIRQRWSFVT